MDHATTLQCGWVAIHLLGLFTACLVRIYAETAAEGLLQAGLLVNLAAVAVATLAGEQFAWPLWTVSGATLAMMIVIAVADFRSQQHDPA